MAKVEFEYGIKCKKCGKICLYPFDILCQQCGTQVLDFHQGKTVIHKNADIVTAKITRKLFKTIIEEV